MWCGFESLNLKAFFQFFINTRWGCHRPTVMAEITCYVLCFSLYKMVQKLQVKLHIFSCFLNYLTMLHNVCFMFCDKFLFLKWIIKNFSTLFTEKTHICCFITDCISATDGDAAWWPVCELTCLSALCPRLCVSAVSTETFPVWAHQGHLTSGDHYTAVRVVQKQSQAADRHPQRNTFRPSLQLVMIFWTASFFCFKLKILKKISNFPIYETLRSCCTVYYLCYWW